jgi:polar amino acid transport system permease protein
MRRPQASALMLHAAPWLICAYAPAAFASGEDSRLPVLVKWLPLILQGFAVDLGISLASMAIGTVLGGLLGIAQVSRSAGVRRMAGATTQFFRNAPWLVILFFCVFLLPFNFTVFGVAVTFPAWAKGIVGLALPVMGNVSEVVRGGIQSIPSGQWEAAESLALNRRQIMAIVIFPQAVKRMLPPWMNVYAVLMMATPLVSIVGVEDSVTVARSMLAAEGDAALLMPVYAFLLILFFLYCAPIARWTRTLEARYAVH